MYCRKCISQKITLVEKIFNHFLQTGFTCVKALEPLGEDRLPLTSLSETLWTHFIDIERMKGQENCKTN